MELIKLKHKEDLRIYHFKDYCITFENVVEFASSKTTHRLKLKDGKLIIVPTKSLRYIEIIANKFTI